mgnify:CR=1 FL=1
MRYANIKNLDISNGPGIRVSLFVSGCRRHCKGCFNEVAQSFEYGTRFGSETLVELLRLLSNPHIKGLSILGGEPLEPENRDTVLDICKAVRVAFGAKKTIWMWTGYLWEDVKDLPVMEYLDVLVDGPFVEEQKNLCLPWCGSENQRVIDVKMSLQGAELVTVPFTSAMKGD